jgi:hypothetical protein
MLLPPSGFSCCHESSGQALHRARLLPPVLVTTPRPPVPWYAGRSPNSNLSRSPLPRLRRPQPAAVQAAAPVPAPIGTARSRWGSAGRVGRRRSPHAAPEATPGASTPQRRQQVTLHNPKQLVLQLHKTEEGMRITPNSCIIPTAGSLISVSSLCAHALIQFQSSVVSGYYGIQLDCCSARAFGIRSLMSCLSMFALYFSSKSTISRFQLWIAQCSQMFKSLDGVFASLARWSIFNDRSAPE